MKWRSVISLSLTLAFLAVCFSGFVLFGSPHCWLAAWMDWRVLGMTREQLIAIHITNGFSFLFLSIIHLILNWKPLVSYLKSSAALPSRESVLSLALFALVVGGTLGKIFPFHQILKGGEAMTASWMTDYALPPKNGHGEQTLRIFCAQANLDLDKAATLLKNRGITATPDDTILALAWSKKLTPPDIYQIIRGAVIEDPSRCVSPLPDFLHESEREVYQQKK